MFKLIGVIVFVSVIVIGYPSLKRWYSGEASPQETIHELRNSVGQKIMTEEPAQATTQAAEKTAPAAPASQETEAERALRRLVEKK